MVLSVGTAGGQDAAHHNKAGVELYNARDFAGAVREFEQALKYAPENATVTKNLANAYHGLALEEGNLENWARAESNARHAVQLQPNRAEFHARLGYYQLRLGDGRGAERSLLEALNLDPNHTNSHINIGKLYYDQDYLYDAIYHWKSALEQEPDLPGVKKMLEKAEREVKIEGEFKQQYSKHFDISFENIRVRREASRVLRMLDQAYYRMARRYRCYPSTPIKVLLYSSDAQFKEATAAALHVGALYDGKIRVPVPETPAGESSLETVLHHEYTHVVVRTLAGNNVPFWLNEGLAQYESETLDDDDLVVIDRAIQSGTLYHLRDLDSSRLDEKNASRVRLAYAQSFAVVDHIMSRFGRRYVTALLEHIRQGFSPEDALRRSMRIDYDRLQAAVFGP